MWNLLLCFILGWSDCSSSEDGDGSCATCWEQLDGMAGLGPYLNKAVGWDLCLSSCSSTTGLHSFQDLSLTLLVRFDWKTLSTVGGAVIQPLAWVWANHTLGLTKLFWASESGRYVPWQIPWSVDEQMSKAWDYYLCSAGVNLVCKDPCTLVTNPSQILSGWTLQIPL